MLAVVRSESLKSTSAILKFVAARLRDSNKECALLIVESCFTHIPFRTPVNSPPNRL